MPGLPQRIKNASETFPGGALYGYSKRLAAQPVIVKWEMSA
jgi:hypothetical protein